MARLLFMLALIAPTAGKLLYRMPMFSRVPSKSAPPSKPAEEGWSDPTVYESDYDQALRSANVSIMYTTTDVRFARGRGCGRLYARFARIMGPMYRSLARKACV